MPRTRSRGPAPASFRRLAGLGLAGVLVLAGLTMPRAVSDTLVISQVYGGGGNAGAPLTHDFVEIHNRASVAVPLTGLSIQYASATGTGNLGANAGQIALLPDVSVTPGGYVLVQLAGGATGVPLPTPDVIDTDSPINMSATGGKVALVTGTTSLGCNGGSTVCTATQLARIVDLVGYGAANFFEGAATAAPSNGTAVVRTAGNVDTDNNAVDFVVAAPAPRGGGLATAVPTLSIDDVTRAEGDDVSQMRFTVSLSAVAGADVFFSVATEDETATQGSDYAALSLTSQVIPAGTRTATVDVTVLGDLVPEPAETFAVVVSGVVGADAGDLVGRGTLTNDDVPLAPISTLQGDGAASPFAGQDVATEGIVTARKTNGFFIQTPDAETDADPDTSEAIFVFTSTLPAVAVGDAVRVSGRLVEFRSASAATSGTLTEITNPSVVVLGSGQPLPAPLPVAEFLVDPAAYADRTAQFERAEGMLVAAAAMDVVGPTNVFGELFAVPAGVPRPFREPGIDVSETLPVEAPPTVPRFDGNFERLMLDSDDWVDASGVRRARLDLPAGAPGAPVQVQQIAGPLDYAFDSFRVMLDGTAVGAGTRAPATVPAPGSGEFMVASLNLENFRDGTPNFAERQQKAARLVVEVLRTPDVLGLIEVGDLGDLQALAALVNAAAGTSYEAYLEDGDGQSTGFEQNVGYLVDAARVEVFSVYQEFRGKTFEFGGATDLLHDRPPLLLEARVRGTGTPLTAILNHTRSLIDVNSAEPFGTSGLTVGARVREKRRLQAEDLADLVAARATQNLVVLGDLNAFEFTDGLVDVVNTIAGVPASVDLVTAPSLDRWTHELVNLATLVPPAERYSYVFEGSAQVLDHVLVNAPMRARLTRFQYARSSADFPESLESDFTVTTRLSDHDAAVAYFGARTDLSIDMTAPATLVAGTPGALFVRVANRGDTATAAAVSVSLPAGAIWQATAAPDGWTCAATAGRVSCEIPTFEAGASAIFGIDVAAACTVPGGTGLGFTGAATAATQDADAADNAAAAAATVSNEGPSITGAAADPGRLPRLLHLLLPVRLRYVASDTCGPVAIKLRVSSDEPVTGPGQGLAGLTSPDWQVLTDRLVLLRAESSSRGDGRVYTIAITATDQAGGTATSTVQVTVPR